jgi:DNA-binding transcriptional LysR family regulator
LNAIVPHKAGQVGRIRIGTGATACIYLLPPILRRLRHAMPGLEIKVETGNTPDLLKLLEDNALDVALDTKPARGRQLVTTSVYDDELVALLPTSEDVQEKAVTPAQLARRPLVLYEPGGRTRGIIDGWFLRAGLSPRPIMELGSVGSHQETGRRGVGLRRASSVGHAGCGCARACGGSIACPEASTVPRRGLATRQTPRSRTSRCGRGVEAAVGRVTRAA